jgi:hypothetical protein
VKEELAENPAAFMHRENEFEAREGKGDEGMKTSHAPAGVVHHERR